MLRYNHILDTNIYPRPWANRITFFSFEDTRIMFSLYQDLLPNIGDIMIEDDSILSNQIQKRQNCAV